MPTAPSKSIHRAAEQPGPPVFKGLPLIGGHPALDLVNSVEYRGRAEPNDVIAGFADLLDWCVLAGLVAREEALALLARPAADPRDEALAVERAGAFREALRVLLDDRATETDTGTAARIVETAIAGLRPEVRYAPETGTIALTFPLRTPADLVARIVDSGRSLLLGRASHRIRRCAGPNCDWLFIDTTKAGHRKWCHSAICGNMVRVRRFREKPR